MMMYAPVYGLCGFLAVLGECVHRHKPRAFVAVDHRVGHRAQQTLSKLLVHVVSPDDGLQHIRQRWEMGRLRPFPVTKS